MRLRLRTAIVLTSSACVLGAGASPAAALDPVKPVCSAARLLSADAGKACSAMHDAASLPTIGNKLATPGIGGATGVGGVPGVGGVTSTLIGGGISRVAASATTALAVATITAITLGGAKFTLDETEKLVHDTTTPQLRSTWFSSLYWRVAGIAAVLTLPFLFAAAIQALLRSDLTLLAHAAFGYLPLAMLAVGVAAPLTMLLLAASDQMSAIVTGTAGDASGQFLERAAANLGSLTTLNTPVVAVFVGVVAIAAGLMLWIELLIRSAAVYVVVLMLPVAFAGMVWPARRVWAIRMVELLVALILSKFAIVAVLALGGAALGTGGSHGVTGLLAGTALLLMGAFTPWAMLRLLPMAELASGAVGSLRGQVKAAVPTELANSHALAAQSRGLGMQSWASRAAEMRREAEATEGEAEGAGSASRGSETEQSGQREPPGTGEQPGETAPEPVSEAASAPPSEPPQSDWRQEAAPWPDNVQSPLLELGSDTPRAYTDRESSPEADDSR